MSMETWLLCEKAPVTVDAQIEQYGNFCKTWSGDKTTLTLIFKAPVSVIISNKPSFER